MKKATLARVFTGAVAVCAAIGMVGCSAETGAPEGQIGSTSEALSVSTLSSGSDAPAGLQFAASCVIHDGHANKDLLLVAGGFDSTGAAQTKLYLYDPVAPSWTSVATGTAQLGTARGYLQAIKDPRSGHENACIFMGGANQLTVDNTATVYSVSDIITINAGTGAVSRAAGASLNTARALFPASRCAADYGIVFGGWTGTAGIATFERYDFANDAWAEDTTASHKLAIGVKEAAVAADSTFRRFIVAGGETAAAVRQDFTLYRLDSTCAVANATNDVKTGTLDYSSTNHPLTQAVAFPSTASAMGATDAFTIAGGDSSTAKTSPLSATHKVEVDFTSNPIAVKAKAADTALAVATRRAKLVNANGTYLVIGGENNSGTGSSVNTLDNVEEYVSGAAWTTSTMGATRDALVGEYIGSTVYVTTGRTVLNGGAASFPVITDAITP